MSSTTTFSTNSLARRRGASYRHHDISSSSSMMVMMPLEGTTAAAVVVASPLSSSLFLLSNQVESWREYVPLVVSALVIIDIAMGRPVAKAIMKPLQQQQPAQPSMISNEDTVVVATNKKERVDTEAIAQQALDQAYASMELRRYLDENKSEAQKLQELRRQMDEEIVKVDAALKERQRKIDAGDY